MAMMLLSCMAPSSRMSPQCGCSWCPGGSNAHRGGRVCNTQGREVGGGGYTFMCSILNCMHLCCAGMEVR